MPQVAQYQGRIEGWFIVQHPIKGEAVRGVIQDSQRPHDFPDGHRIITSPIVTMSGPEVVTHSGSLYMLGREASEEEIAEQITPVL